MEHDVEENLGLLQAEKGLEEDEMCGAADGDKLSQPLHDPQKNGLKYSNGKPLSPQSYNNQFSISNHQCAIINEQNNPKNYLLLIGD